MSRRRAASDASVQGFGLFAPAPQPAPGAPKRAKPLPARPAPQPAPAPVVELPQTPWGRVAAECPDRRGVDAHELAFEHWSCSCGWSGEALREHRCAGVAVLGRRAWVHIERASGGPVRCVQGRAEPTFAWDTLEWSRGGLARERHVKPAPARFAPIGGLAYVDRVTVAYSAAEAAGRRVCADAPTATKLRCGCSPAGLCAVARGLVERLDERRMLRDAGAEVPRAVWRHAFGMTEAVLRAHLAGAMVTSASGRWWVAR